jgi:hypothetical protein
MTNHELSKNLQSLSTIDLFATAKSEVQTETNSTLRVIYVLLEIERRRAFAEKNYPSLFEFCVGFLGYKRDAAYRRIAAMRALRDAPEVEEKVKAGSLSLSTLAQAQSHFSRKKRENVPLTKPEKLELFTKLENLSVRQTEELFTVLTPKEIPKETLKYIDDETFEWRLTLPKRVYEKLQKLKTHLGPKKTGVDSIEALEKALDIANREFEKKFEKSERKLERLRNLSRNSKIKIETPENLFRCTPNEFEASERNLEALESSFETLKSKFEKSENKLKNPEKLQAKFRTPRKSKYISVHTKRKVWKRDQGQCAHVDETTGERCPSRYRLEVDHVIARALGGSNETENLRLTCRAHNQLAAIKTFGLQTMNQFILRDQQRVYNLMAG